MSLESVLEEYKESYEKTRKQIEKSLKEDLSNIFKECPSLGMFLWTQYTPGFNDGDPCEFTIGEIYTYNKAGGEAYILERKGEPFREDIDEPVYFSDINDYDEPCSEFALEHFNPNNCSYKNDKEIAKWNSKPQDEKDELDKINRFVKTLSHIPSKFFEDIFGNDVKVTVVPGEIIIEGYNCGY